MKTNKVLSIHYRNSLVGTLALTKQNQIAFEYDDQWIEHGFSISPFSLPLRKEVFVPVKPYFQGLFGVFADSLPDAWGNILVNRVLRKNGLNPAEITPLDRLAIVGTSGMGALTYHPEVSHDEVFFSLDYDNLATECKKILLSEPSEELDTLYRLGGTSGGARPKIFTTYENEDWIIKFPAHSDSPDIGKMEYDYSRCATACGITMSDTKLFSSNQCQGYFGTKRFDRQLQSDGSCKRIHMLTAAALLELDFNQPSLDYHELMKLTKILTHDNKEDVENLFLRMCFNVFAHNRDDHSKNFSYLYDEEIDMWRLAPAYDLTYSNTYYGEHTTSVDGNGANPGEKELLAVGLKAGLSKQRCNNMIEHVKSKIAEFEL